MSDPEPALLPSPCVGICRLDRDTGWCVGCARSTDELAAWRDLPDEARHAVWADLPRRRRKLGLAFRLLPWQGRALLDRLAEASRRPGADWSIGVYGAVGELSATSGSSLTVAYAVDGLLLRAPGGALRLRLPAGIRAFELARRNGRADRIVLTLHRARMREPLAAALADLGHDSEAIEPARRLDHLFDLGLNRPPIRFCIRTDDAALRDTLRRAAGRDVLDPATGLVPRLLAASPDRVVTSPVGRIEISGPILGGRRDQPHTHLLPALLAQDRQMEPGLELPPDYLACATLHSAGDAHCD